MEEVLYLILFFIFGTVMGSFYHVIATRLTTGESIVYPPSHCHNCNHKLKWYELIPLFSYLMQGGKCRSCHEKIPISYFLMELVTGIMFAICYHKFELSFDTLVALIFVSALITVIVSDIEYMVILDEVLIVASVMICLIQFFTIGFEQTSFNLLAGAGAFVTMYLVKIIGDFIFKKESLGGGDIKLMFLFGLVLGYPMAIASIFLATFIAFPVALVILAMHKDNVIPFGPFLSMSAILIYVAGVTVSDIINFLV